MEQQTKKEESKIRAATRKALDWCNENKTTLLFITGGIATLGKLGGKVLNVFKEKHLQERTCYDRSLGHYWQLNRTLSNKEWIAIEERRKNGERLADILKDLKVLK